MRFVVEAVAFVSLAVFMVVMISRVGPTGQVGLSLIGAAILWAVRILINQRSRGGRPGRRLPPAHKSEQKVVTFRD